nr:uncharacterized protein LOC105494306 [Macaca nemestrina]
MKVDTFTLKFASHRWLQFRNMIVSQVVCISVNAASKLPVSENKICKRRLPRSCADSGSGVCARAPGAVEADSPPPGCAISKPPNRKSNFNRPPGVLLRALDPNPGQKQGRGLSAVLHPHYPQDPGAGTTYRSARPPGAAARPGRFRRALSLGRKRNRVDGRRALTRRLLCGERRGQAGAGAERGAEGGPREAGAESAQFPSLAPRGTRNAGWRAAGGGRAPEETAEVAPSSGINYCLGARAPARAVPEAQRPPSRPPAGEKTEGAPNTGSKCGGPGSEGPRWARATFYLLSCNPTHIIFMKKAEWCHFTTRKLS